MHVDEVDLAGHQPFQRAPHPEPLTAAQHPMRVQRREQRLDRGRPQREMEFHLGAARVRRHVAQARAFRQRDGQRPPDQRGELSHAVVDIGIGVALAAQRRAQRRVLARRRQRAIAPGAPGGERDMLERRMQHVAETAAGVARIDHNAGRISDGGQRFGFVVAATLDAVAARGRRRGVRAGRLVAELGEAVHPPVARQRAAGVARFGHGARGFGRQRQPRALGWAVVEDDVGMRAQRTEVVDHRRERGRPGLVESPRRQPQRVLGAGQADIEQARILGALFVLPGHDCVLPALRRIVLARLPVQHAPLLAGYLAMARRLVVLPADADERQEHQRKLQALALVQGQDLHAVRIRLEPEQLLLVVRVGLGDPRAQPVDEAVQAERAGVGLLQQFAQLQQVGQPAFAVDETEQAFGMARAQVGDQGERALSLPALAPLQGVELAVPPPRVVAVEAGDAGAIDAQQHRGQRGAQAALVGGLQQGVEYRQQLLRLLAVEQALLAGRDRGDAAGDERRLHARGLGVAAHEHGDVAGPYRPARDRGAAAAGIGEHRMDFRDAGRGGERARVVGLARLAVGGGRQDADGQRRGRGAFALVVGVVVAGAGLDRVEADAAVDERAVAGLRVQRLDRAQQARARAEIVEQRWRDRGVTLRREVGVHVAAAEAVDRLLRVADQEQRRRGRRSIRLRAGIARTEHAPEDRPLPRIGVLELVDQRDRVLRAQAGHERIAMRPVERIGHAVDEVVEGLQPAHVLELRQAPAGLGAQAVQQADAASGQPLPARVVGVDERRNRTAQR